MFFCNIEPHATEPLPLFFEGQQFVDPAVGADGQFFQSLGKPLHWIQSIESGCSQQQLDVGACPATTSTNQENTSQQRAYAQTTTVWRWLPSTTTWHAQGSNDNLGTSGTTLTTLYQGANGSWHKTDPANCPVEQAAGWLYYHNDHLGTPQRVTNAEGEIVWAATVTPFGEVIETVTDFEQNIRFPGQYHDRETGLYYNWHRYYSPELGRYITSDPIDLAGGLNTYGYAGGNPLQHTDPTGLEVLVCMDPAFGGNVPFDHYWIKTDKYEVGMGGDGRGPLGTGATIVDHAGRSEELGASCRAPKTEVNEECVDRYIEATVNEPFGHWFPPVNYCKIYVGWLIMQCKTK